MPGRQEDVTLVLRVVQRSHEIGQGIVQQHGSTGVVLVVVGGARYGNRRCFALLLLWWNWSSSTGPGFAAIPACTVLAFVVVVSTISTAKDEGGIGIGSSYVDVIVLFVAFRQYHGARTLLPQDRAGSTGRVCIQIPR